MLVSKKWLAELVEINVEEVELLRLLNNKTIGTKEVTDEFIELDMKGYNRADLLSLRGVANEVSAITESPLLFKEPLDADFYWVEKQLEQVDISVESDQLSPLYALVKIEGLRVDASSPDWQQKLKASGMRSVNNLTDVTNLVMLEYGQPLHAFDASKVDGAIQVRQASQGEKLITLDHKERSLESNDIVIADDKKAVGLAGVMGGENTEVTDETTTILLEAAIFDPVQLRKTANRLSLSSEASKRFYHGLTAKRLFQALDAAIRMYEHLGGKVTGMSIVGETLDQLKTIPLRLSRVNSLIGETLTAAKIEEYLERLHCILSDKVESPEISWVVTVPYFRLDLELEEDLIEEVARMYGYEKITSHKAPEGNAAKINQSKFDFLRKLGETASSLGLTEVSTYPYFSTKTIDAIGWGSKDKSFLVKIKNPISNETEYLRQSVWPNLVEVIDKNVRQGFKDIAIFEVGKAYYFDESGNPKEGYRLAIALMNGTDNPLAELNAIIGKIKEKISSELEIKQVSPGEIAKDFVHPVRYMEVFKDERQIGGMSEVHKRMTDSFGIEKKVAVFEIDLEAFIK